MDYRYPNLFYTGVNCCYPGDQSNAHLTLDCLGTLFEANATYICDDNYAVNDDLETVFQITCLANGSWSFTNASCRREYQGWIRESYACFVNFLDQHQYLGVMLDNSC